jgi:hypothetical protein
LHGLGAPMATSAQTCRNASRRWLCGGSGQASARDEAESGGGALGTARV